MIVPLQSINHAWRMQGKFIKFQLNISFDLESLKISHPAATVWLYQKI